VREVPVHRGLAATLAAWRSRWPEWYGREPADADLIVPARAHRARVSLGGPRRQAAVWRELQRDLEAAGLRAHRIHDLRHTFVSLCADAGMAADVVSRWTHAPVSTSSARHLYLVPSWARQCAEMERLEVALSSLAVSVPESLPRHG
jgi:integrase